MRILIVDDDLIALSGWRATLESDLDVEVFEASDGRDGYSLYLARMPDIVIVNLNLPGLSGLKLVRRILRRKPKEKILIFTTNEDPVAAALAIEAGAKGYIAKNHDPGLLSNAVKSVADGGVYLRPEMAREIAFLRAEANAPKISSLSKRELRILRLIAAGRTVAEIAEELDFSYRTTANNCALLKQKLGARSAADLMRIVLLDAKL